ncbi:L-rhamnose mutarotase, partial [Pantoea agglomerans]|nr:L-rhamnose mutarotase [Pantoea agglomerans]
MPRRLALMQVNPYCHAEYERRHSPIWPELAETLKAHGAHNYAIWLDA